MKAVIIDRFIKVRDTRRKAPQTDLNQSYDEIRVSEVPEPIQSNGEVLVRVEAAGLNFVDLLYVRNLEYLYAVCV